MKDEKTIKLADDIREIAELLRELNTDDKTRILGIAEGMALARKVQEKADDTVPAKTA